MEHFDAVVVGSGFGGSVLACRLAEGDQSVCLLERGRTYPPGSFPRRPAEMSKNFWDPSRRIFGLYNLWSFRGLEALVSSGLGGGSLIYANVMIRKDERWFVKEDSSGGYEHWPVTRADLDPHYDRVEKALGATPYPFDRLPYSQTPKTLAFRQAALRRRLDWTLPNLAVTFGNNGEPPAPGVRIEEPEPNLHGKPRYSCMLVAECDVGCNYGSKNSLDFNYLSAAKRAGADIRVLCEVKTFRPLQNGGFEVAYVEHHPDEEDPPPTSLRLITAKRLILSAGTLGTTYLLLKNRSSFPGLSKRIGTQFSGNGDLLSFAVGAIEAGGALRKIQASYGPVISSTVRVADTVDGGDGRGFYVQDAGWPQFVDWMLESYNVPSTVRRGAMFALRRAWARLTNSPVSDLSFEIGHVLGDAALSSTSLPLLGMGRDIPDGRMRLRKGYLDIDWTTKTSRAYLDRVRDTMREITRELGGSFVDNPIWYLKRVITVHPLGGCPMGQSAAEGVVSPYGEVFGYPGLYIADGSVMPGPVGPNPSLTIAALADRFADRMLV